MSRQKTEKDNMRIISIMISLLMCIVLIGCKPDSLEIEIYTSDVESASGDEVIEVPLKATFSLMGEDKENQLPVAKNIALKADFPCKQQAQGGGNSGKMIVNFAKK